ncbi:MAG: protein translocase subunit SecF [bacterium]
MQIFSKVPKINFIGIKHITLGISLLALAASVASLIVKGGPNYGIDFMGGTIVQLKFNHEIKLGELRSTLKKMNFGDLVVQTFGEKKDNEVLIRIENSSTSLVTMGEHIKQAVAGKFGKETFELRRVEMVGPKVGKDLRSKGMWALFYSMLGIMLYVAWRFELKFAVAAIIALSHDVILTVGVFSLTGKEFTLTTVAALLTIAGYSINDTIVVFDRFRENLKFIRKGEYGDIQNLSINETLSRTVLTSLTTLIVTVILMSFGGGVIFDFAFALTIGVVIGTYSSVFVASPIVNYWHKYSLKREEKASAKAVKEKLSAGKENKRAAKPKPAEKKTSPDVADRPDDLPSLKAKDKKKVPSTVRKKRKRKH